MQEADRINDAERRLISQRLDAQATLMNERWTSHTDIHQHLEKSLDEYKASANEWRSLVSDMKADFLPQAEWSVEHKGLIARIELLEQQRVSSLAEQRAIREVFAQFRNLTLLIVALVGVAITVLVFFRA